MICRLHRGGRIEQHALTLTIVLHFKVLKRYCCNNFQGLALRALIMFYGKIKSAYRQNIEGHNLERHWLERLLIERNKLESEII